MSTAGTGRELEFRRAGAGFHTRPAVNGGIDPLPQRRVKPHGGISRRASAHIFPPLLIATFRTSCYRSVWEVSPRAPHLKESNEKQLRLTPDPYKCARS